MKKVLKTISIILLWALISAVCISEYYDSRYKFDLTHISCIRSGEDSTVIVDDDDFEINILQLDENYQIIDTLTYYKTYDGYYNLPADIMFCDNEYYLCNLKNRVGVNESLYDIYRLNFNRSQMELVFSFNLDDLSSEIGGRIASVESFDVHNGKLYISVLAKFGNRHILVDLCNDNSGFDMYNLTTIGDELTDIAIDTNKNFVGIGNKNHIYRNSKDDTVEAISSDSYKLIYSTNNADTIYAANLTHNRIDRLSLDGEPLSPIDIVYEQTLDDIGIAASEISCIGTSSADTLLAAYYIEENIEENTEKNVGIIEYCDSAPRVYSCLYRGGTSKLLASSAAMVLLAGLITLLIILLILYMRRGRSIILKIVLTEIPIMIFIIYLSMLLVGIMFSINMGYLPMLMNMSELSNQIISAEAKSSEAEPAEIINSILSDETINSPDIVHAERDDSLNSSEVFLNYNFYYYELDEKSGSYVGIISECNGMAVNEYFEPSFADTIANVAETGSVSGAYRYDADNKYMLYYIFPKSDDSGKTVGIYMISASESEANANTEYQLLTVTLLEGILCVIVIAVFLIILFVSLRSLKNLRNQANRLQNGEKNCRVKSSALIDDISVIAKKFNQTAEQVETNLDRIKALRERFKAYLPDALLEVTGKKSAALLNPNESYVSEVYVLYLILPKKYDSFDKLNELSKNIADKLDDCGGFFANVRTGEIMIVSRSSDSVSLAAAIAEENPDVAVIADRTAVVVKILGNNEQYLFSTAPEDKERYSKLVKLSKSMDAKLIITQGAIDRFGSDISARLCAFVGNERLYEVSFGANKGIRKLTRQYFEKGVELFDSEEFLAARRMFIQVLKTDPFDSGARYYIGLID